MSSEQLSNLSDPISALLKKFFGTLTEGPLKKVYLCFFPVYIFPLFFIILIDPLPRLIPYQ